MPKIVRAQLPTPDAVILRGLRGQVVVLADVRVPAEALAAVVTAARVIRDLPVMSATA